MTCPTSWFDIDLDVISQNVKNIKAYIGDTKLLTVVKADAYGHGIIPVAVSAIESGADYIGVSNLEEGVMLRQNGIKAPILLLNALLPHQAEDAIHFGLTVTVCSFDVVQVLNDIAAKRKERVCIHIKVDTGFGRFGVLPEHALEFVKIISSNFINIDIEGIYTHFSSANNETTARRQFKKFNSVIDQLKAADFNIPIKHACNSVATLKYPDMHLDMVRVGNLTYGLCPSKGLPIKNPGKVFSKILSLKTLPAGHNIGYGNRFRTRKPTEVAVVPFGYYDGLELLVMQPNGIWDGIKALLKQIIFCLGFPGINRKVRINGHYCDILGKISMQNCMVDVTALKGDVFIGDNAELFPRKINLRQDLPRVYHKEGRSFVDNRTMSPTKALEEESDYDLRGETSIG